MSDRYQDILHLPHPNPTTRSRMSIASRAAQFAPFAALTGYEQIVEETARFTQAKRELDEDEKALLNRKLLLLLQTEETPKITVTFFTADECKVGGAYHTLTDTVLQIDLQTRRILMANHDSICFEDVIALESDCFFPLNEE